MQGEREHTYTGANRIYQLCSTHPDTVAAPVRDGVQVRRLSVDRVNRLRELLKELSELDSLWAQGHRADAFRDYRKFLLDEIAKLKEEVSDVN